MAITRYYDPWTMMTQLQNEMNKLFETRMGRYPGEDAGNVVTSQWTPAVDIKEEKDRFVIFADIPGVDPKDIEITMEKGIISIKGERRIDTEEERENYTRVERARGIFYRRFTLPDTADVEKISARGKNGVLEITIPKHEKLQPRKITVEDGQ
ncbi:MAG: Hsp20/alpha crystallin family protein [Gammaproteobacteria bacterium]